MPGAQPRFDMGHWNLTVIGRQRAAHRRGGIALHHHPIGPFGIEHLPDPCQQARRQRVEALIGLHHIEIVIGRHARDLQHLIEHPAMLPGDADPADEARIAFQRMNEREQLDRFGPGAENGEDFACHAPPLTANG